MIVKMTQIIVVMSMTLCGFIVTVVIPVIAAIAVSTETLRTRSSIVMRYNLLL